MAEAEDDFGGDDGGDMKPPQASELTGKQLADELVARGRVAHDLASRLRTTSDQ